MRRHRRMVGNIIQERLARLSELSRSELEQQLGLPAEHLVMGEDQRPYLMTSVLMRRPDGSIWAHVYVATGGWDEVEPVIRSAALIR
ncbi:hypothetical protein [Rugosimonospora africana]|uniref:Uncharacterized protein n=1 Tax=Rugosimonospora africana TaxID=556532 RepID=A0A8J3QNA5_9ACTN|nr:hypothetical protein [Rugosimonospora africana]GIH13084.1 hypothetical protein Raf01_12560 [Rugosimonospora africana]